MTTRWRKCSGRRRPLATTPALQATIGLIYSRKGDLRRGINAVKRAYPQYLAAGGEELPADVLEVLFPGGLLEPDSEVRAAARPRPVSDRGADGAGVDVRRRHPVARQRDRPDADRAGHRASLRARR